MNRTRDPKMWGHTICQVVYQKGQFSWSRNEKFELRRHQHSPVFRSIEAKAALWIVEDALDIRYVKPRLQHATFFSQGRPRANHLAFVEKVGHHQFYKIEAR